MLANAIPLAPRAFPTRAHQSGQRSLHWSICGHRGTILMDSLSATQLLQVQQRRVSHGILSLLMHRETCSRQHLAGFLPYSMISIVVLSNPTGQPLKDCDPSTSHLIILPHESIALTVSDTESKNTATVKPLLKYYYQLNTTKRFIISSCRLHGAVETLASQELPWLESAYSPCIWVSWQ